MENQTYRPSLLESGSPRIAVAVSNATLSNINQYRSPGHNFSTPPPSSPNHPDAMASPNDSECSYYTARDHSSNPTSPGSITQSPGLDDSNVHPFTAQDSELFNFAVPMIPIAKGLVAKSVTSGDNIGLNIFASPPPRDSSDEEFVSPTILADAANANEWDVLLSARTTKPVTRATNRWDRDSLFQRFDPLVRNTTPPQQRFATGEQCSSTQFFTPTEDQDHQVPINGFSEADVTVVADEQDCDDDGDNTFVVSNGYDFPHRQPDSRRESMELEATLNSDNTITLFEQIEENEARMETALAQQEMNLRAEISERDYRIEELESRLAELQLSIKITNEQDSQAKNELARALDQINSLEAALLDAEGDKRSTGSQMELLAKDLVTNQSAFDDLNKKYDRAKVELENYRCNEEILIERDAAMTSRIRQTDSQLEEIRNAVKFKLENMFQHYETKFKAMDAETARLRAQARRAELKVEGLENEVVQKMGEIKKLNALCDDLILQNMKNGGSQ